GVHGGAMSMRERHVLIALFVTILSAQSNDAAAETPDAQRANAAAPSAGIEEILVSARRRTESLEDVPMSVSALTGEELAQRQVKSIQEAFTYTPNVTYEYSGYNTSSRVYIRGIGNAGAHFLTGDPSVALYMNGVYQARAATGIFDVVDIDRVEVL